MTLLGRESAIFLRNLVKSSIALAEVSLIVARTSVVIEVIGNSDCSMNYGVSLECSSMVEYARGSTHISA